MNESEPTNQISPKPQRPITNDRQTWLDYWQANGQSWRTEPEISIERQKTLEHWVKGLAAIALNFPSLDGTTSSISVVDEPIEVDCVDLNRADFEWLLAEYNVENHQFTEERTELKLVVSRENLCRINLAHLPLQEFHFDGAFALTGSKGAQLYEVNLENANLRGANLHGANLQRTNLRGANLQEANLQKANLEGTIFQSANLRGAHLEEANPHRFRWIPAPELEGQPGHGFLPPMRRVIDNSVTLYQTDFSQAILREAWLQDAVFRDADFQGAHLEKADLQRAHLEDADLQGAFIQGAHLEKADLQRAILRGADLQNSFLQEANLQEADLSPDVRDRFIAGEVGVKTKRSGKTKLQSLSYNKPGPVSEPPRKTNLQGANLQNANLRGAKLQEAKLNRAILKETQLRGANLQKADLQGADLQGMDLRDIHLQGANLQGAHLENADLQRAFLQGADLQNSFLQGANLQEADLSRFADHNPRHIQPNKTRKTNLQGANLRNANLRGANLQEANLQGVDLQGMGLQGTHFEKADLRGAILKKANLQNANLQDALLQGADLQEAHLEDADLQRAHVEGSDLSEAFFSRGTKLRNIHLADKKESMMRRFISFLNSIIVPVQGKRNDAKQFISLAGVHWGEADLSVVDWRQLYRISEEDKARRTKKPGMRRLEAYRSAVRANRQLAVALQEQGLNEEATKFAFRAQNLQRKVFWNQGYYGRWFFSLLLARLAGYGYRMSHILAAYLFIVLLCAGAYFVLGMYGVPHHPISWSEAVLTSVTAFHGRVFSDPLLQFGELQRWVTAFEAVAGFVIEGIFIAMLVQRFFGK